MKPARLNEDRRPISSQKGIYEASNSYMKLSTPIRQHILNEDSMAYMKPAILI
jgi:hypothetical protein